MTTNQISFLYRGYTFNQEQTLKKLREELTRIKKQGEPTPSPDARVVCIGLHGEVRQRITNVISAKKYGRKKK